MKYKKSTTISLQCILISEQFVISYDIGSIRTYDICFKFNLMYVQYIIALYDLTNKSNF